ncbi:hypothetical protein [Streptosporangium sp. V21-05]|uniref:hypothetical protein n=1 Tax=Streptosporangium sp. V21-05 TaxID=3446115 RepID=UPI003F52CB1D
MTDSDHTPRPHLIAGIRALDDVSEIHPDAHAPREMDATAFVSHRSDAISGR